MTEGTAISRMPIIRNGTKFVSHRRLFANSKPASEPERVEGEKEDRDPGWKGGRRQAGEPLVEHDVGASEVDDPGYNPVIPVQVETDAAHRCKANSNEVVLPGYYGHSALPGSVGSQVWRHGWQSDRSKVMALQRTPASSPLCAQLGASRGPSR